MALKWLFFVKNCPAAGGFAPRPPLVIRLYYTSLFTASPNSDIFGEILVQALPFEQNPWLRG